MSTAAPEFSRMVDRRHLGAEPLVIEATEAECAAVARRFEIASIAGLRASLVLTPDGEAVDAAGRLEARIVQDCAVSGDPLVLTIDEQLAFRFVPEPAIDAEELELEAEDLDEIFYSGTAFDLGEAVAQSLALAIDPYATGPEADRVRQEAGLAEKPPQGPLQEALAKLRKAE